VEVTVPGVCAFLSAPRVREVASIFGVTVPDRQTWCAPSLLERRGVTPRQVLECLSDEELWLLATACGLRGERDGREELIQRILRCDDAKPALAPPISV
jgi:hypothetical protein